VLTQPASGKTGHNPGMGNKALELTGLEVSSVQKHLNGDFMIRQMRKFIRRRIVQPKMLFLHSFTHPHVKAIWG